MLTCVFCGAFAHDARAMGNYLGQVAAIVFAAMGFFIRVLQLFGFSTRSVSLSLSLSLSSVYSVFILILFMYGLLYITPGTAFFVQRHRLGDSLKRLGLSPIIGGIGRATLLLFPVDILTTLAFEVLLVIALLGQYRLHKKKHLVKSAS